MSRKLLLFSIFILIFVLSLSTSHAQGNSPEDRGQGKFKPQISVSQEERKLEREERITELKEKLEEKKASISARLSERRKINIQKYWERLNARLMAAIDRLDLLTQRIESRLTTIEENNPEVDTTDVHTQLDEAVEMLTEAKTKLAAMEDVADEALDSENPKDAFVIVRSGIMEIKDMLKSVHKVLVHVIGDIKGLRVGQEDLNGVTVTPTVTPEETPTATPTATLTLTPSPEPTFTVTPTP